MKVAFIGLGSMGSGMAQNILNGGHELTVYNRTRSRAEPFEKAGAHVADSPADAARGADVVMTMLANDAAVEDMVFGPDGKREEGVISGLEKEKVHISCSTISVELSKRMARAQSEAGQDYLAVPVFGRPDAAAAGKLAVVTSGDEALIDRCRPVLDSIGQAVFVVGKQPWDANVVKIAGNFLIASMLEAMGESFALIRKSGIKPAKFLEVFTALFRSPVYQNYGSIIAEKNFESVGFALRLGLKDVKLALQTAEGVDMPMPLGSLVRDHFLTALAHGEGDIDWSGIARVIARESGLTD